MYRTLDTVATCTVLRMMVHIVYQKYIRDTYIHNVRTYVSMYVRIHICTYMHIHNMEEDWLHCSWMLHSAHVCSAEGFNLTVNCLVSIHVQSLKSTLMNCSHVWCICTHVCSPNTSSPAPSTVRDWAQCHTAHLRGCSRNIACNRRLYHQYFP